MLHNVSVQFDKNKHFKRFLWAAQIKFLKVLKWFTRDLQVIYAPTSGRMQWCNAHHTITLPSLECSQISTAETTWRPLENCWLLKDFLNLKILARKMKIERKISISWAPVGA